MWWFRLWRFAVARPGDPVLAGRRELRTEHGRWRRLWWLLWWGTYQPVLGRPPAPEEAAGELDQPLLHWVEPQEQRPLCGALGVPWTMEWDYVSCPECRRIGTPIRLQYTLSTR